MASRDIIAAIGLLIFSGLYAWATFYIPDRTIPNTPGPSFFPFVIITIVAILSAALLVKGIAGLRSGDRTEIQSSNQSSNKSSAARLSALTLGAFGIFLAVLPWAGFLIAGIVFFAVLMFLYGSREPVKIGLWSLVLPSVLYVIFTEGFQILLPSGPFGF